MRAKLKLAASFAKEVAQEFKRDRGGLFAAAISYYGLISLIPLLLLAIAVFGHVMGSYVTARREVAVFIGNLIPVGAKSLERSIEQLSRQVSLVGGLGILGLLWTGLQVFVTLQEVMNVAVGAEKSRGYFRARWKALVTVIVAGVLFGLSIGVTSLLAAARGLHLGVDLSSVHILWDFLGLATAYLLSVTAFTFAYAFLPAKRIGVAGPMLGGVVAGLLFEAAKHIFKWYVSNLGRFDVIYGPLAGAVVLVVWMYCAALITVIGAEVASVYAMRRQPSV
jgi:membrane protein